jgi:D-apionolactonase
MMDLRALTHEAAPGLRVTCRMEGDTFEMEDQRNWTDASFKTYCTPLAEPFPVLVEPGDRVDQQVTVIVSQTADQSANGQAAAESDVVEIATAGEARPRVEAPRAFRR